MPKKPVAPPIKADIKEHKKHAKEILEIEEYKYKPSGHPAPGDETDTPVNP